MARVLAVWLNQQLIGHLEQDRSGALWFGYTDEWLATPGAMPLSHSLPLRKERFKQKECRPFFAGLLPEEQSREGIAKVLGVSSRNDFALLERIGGECAGAVALLPPDVENTSDGSYRELSPHELAQRIDELPRRPLLAGENGVRLSLAGVQGKIPLALDAEGRYFLPLNGAPSTHILKPAHPHFGHLVENECFCMQLARLAGLEAAAVRIGQAEGRSFLLVERYDRIQDGSVQRLHQEDFCQALGIPPEMKYQQEGGPGLKQAFQLVRTVSSAPGADVLRLFRAVVFNYLIGNNDAHGKNFSFLYHRNGQIRLAPLYDLVSTQVYPELSPEMAMSIGKERDPRRLTGKHWAKFFDDTGLNPTLAARELKRLAQTVLKVLPAVEVSHAHLPALVQENGQRLLSL